MASKKTKATKPKPPKHNKHGLGPFNRDGPIARQIRQECGFGCIVCGSCFYQYEHIDPEYNDAKKHDPARMGLLCGACHDKVTRKIWSKDKVKECRDKPFCLSSGFSSDLFDYSDSPTVIIGGLTIYRPKFVLRIFGQPLLEVKGPESPGGPVRITGVFYDSDGNLVGSLKDNCWIGQVENWDIEAVGGRITVRREPGNIALVLRTEARKSLIIERLDMFYKGIRVYADEQGVYFGPPDKKLLGLRGTSLEPISCIEVMKDNGREMSCGIKVSISDVENIGRFENNTASACDLAFAFHVHDLIIGVGYKALTTTLSIVKA